MACRPVTPLVAGSNGPPSADPFGDGLEGGGQQPWPECLRGDIAAGFSLVVYEGGSVDELEACAQSRDITALYALSEGEFVSYILGAPEFVTQPFRDLFADGLPLMTPLVAKERGAARRALRPVPQDVAEVCLGLLAQAQFGRQPQAVRHDAARAGGSAASPSRCGSESDQTKLRSCQRLHGYTLTYTIRALFVLK